MTVIGTAFIAVKPDLAGFAGSVDKAVATSGSGAKAEKAGKGIGSKFGGALKAGAALAGAGAVAGVVSFGKASVAAAKESQVAQARLGQVFSSMGDKTGSATRAAEKYAGVLQKQTAIDDEQIMAAQTKLATFGKVSDETARQSGIFDRATKAAADLAAAGFGSLGSNATQLGKALQDPVKGMSALTRVGVTFTAEQKKQIKALVESGQQTKAQKIILGAIEKQVGGTAAATATASDKMKNSFGEFQEQVGGLLQPALAGLADIATNTLIPALSKMVGFISKNKTIILPLAAAVAGLAVGIKAITAAQKAWKAAQEAWNVVTKVATGIQAAFNAVMDANPIVLVVIGIAALVAALIIAYKKVGWFHDAVDALWQGLQAAFDVIIGASKAVISWLANNWQTVLAILTGPIGLAVLFITRNWDTIRNTFMSVVGAVLGFLKANWPKILAIITGPIGIAVLLIVRNWNTIRNATQAAWQFVSRIVSGAAGAIGRIVSGLVGTVTRSMSSAWNGAVRIVSGAINSIVRTVSGLPGRILGYVKSLASAGAALGGALLNGMRSAITGAAGLAGDIGGALLSALKAAWNDFARGANAVIPNSIGFGPASIDLPDNPIPTFDAGGLVPGRRGAPLLAVVHGGEYVIPAREVAGGGSTGQPAVAIAQATFVEPVDVDVLINRVRLALTAGRL